MTLQHRVAMRKENDMQSIDLAIGVFLAVSYIALAYVMIAGAVYIGDHVVQTSRDVQKVSASAAILYIPCAFTVLYIASYVFAFPL